MKNRKKKKNPKPHYRWVFSCLHFCFFGLGFLVPALLGTFYSTNLEVVLRVGFAEGLPVILDPGVLGQHVLHALGRGLQVTLCRFYPTFKLLAIRISFKTKSIPVTIFSLF